MQNSIGEKRRLKVYVLYCIIYRINYVFCFKPNVKSNPMHKHFETIVNILQQKKVLLNELYEFFKCKKNIKCLIYKNSQIRLKAPTCYSFYFFVFQYSPQRQIILFTNNFSFVMQSTLMNGWPSYISRTHQSYTCPYNIKFYIY